MCFHSAYLPRSWIPSRAPCVLVNWTSERHDNAAKPCRSASRQLQPHLGSPISCFRHPCRRAVSFPFFRMMLDCSYCLSLCQHTYHRRQQLTFTKYPWAPDVGEVGRPLGRLVTHRLISCLFSRQNCWSIFSDFSMAGKTLESALKITSVAWSPPSLRIYWWLLWAGGKGICGVGKKWKIKILKLQHHIISTFHRKAMLVSFSYSFNRYLLNKVLEIQWWVEGHAVSQHREQCRHILGT